MSRWASVEKFQRVLAPRLHPERRFHGLRLLRCAPITEMDPDTLEILRMRYRAAYDAYQQRARRVSQKLESGATPTAAEIDDEAQALQRLTTARQALRDALAEADRR